MSYTLLPKIKQCYNSLNNTCKRFFSRCTKPCYSGTCCTSVHYFHIKRNYLFIYILLTHLVLLLCYCMKNWDLSFFLSYLNSRKMGKSFHRNWFLRRKKINFHSSQFLFSSFFNGNLPKANFVKLWILKCNLYYVITYLRCYVLDFNFLNRISSQNTVIFHRKLSSIYVSVNFFLELYNNDII